MESLVEAGSMESKAALGQQSLGQEDICISMRGALQKRISDSHSEASLRRT